MRRLQKHFKDWKSYLECGLISGCMTKKAIISKGYDDFFIGTLEHFIFICLIKNQAFPLNISAKVFILNLEEMLSVLNR